MQEFFCSSLYSSGLPSADNLVPYFHQMTSHDKKPFPSSSLSEKMIYFNIGTPQNGHGETLFR